MGWLVTVIPAHRKGSVRPGRHPGSGAALPNPQTLAAFTVGCWIALAFGQVCTQDGIVEAVEVGGHAVVALVIVEHLERNRGLSEAPKAESHGPRRPGQQLTWATLRTAIFRTIGGARAPKDAGMDFCTLPKVMAPYLLETGGRGGEARQPSARHPCSQPLLADSPV